MTGNNAITSKQMARFTFVCQTGIGIIALPTIVAKEVGHDGWISIIATGIIAVVLSTLIVVLLRRYSDKAIYDINKLLFGKIAGTALNILLFFYLLFAAAGGIGVFLFYLEVTLFPLTPPLILAPLILLPSIYMVWQGLKVVSRFKAVTMVAYTVVIIYIALIIKEFRITFIMPVGEAGFMPLLSSMKSCYFAYVGLELIAFFYPEITDKDKALKWHINASLFSMIFFIIIVMACTLVFGENLLSIQIIPLFNLSRVYNAPILERVDIYIISAWFVAMGCSIRAYMMAAYYSLGKILNLKKSKLVYTLFIIVLIIISLLPEDINETLMVLEIINYAGMAVVLHLIICLVISMFKKKGVVGNISKT